MNTWNMFLNIKNDYKMPYYPPRRGKNSTQTFFQLSNPSARLIFNSMFVVVVLYCVKRFLKICFVQNPSLLSFSFPFVVFSILLSYLFILLDFSKCLMSQNIGCLVKTQLFIFFNSTQTIFHGGSPWAALIFNSMFAVVVLFCVKLFFWSEHFPAYFSPLFVLSFANSVFFFNFLSSILLEFSKCPISQNIGCLIKTQWKNSTHTIFQEGSPWAALIFNSMFVVVVLYCVKFFLKICFVQNPSLLSFSFPFVVFSILLSYLFILLDFSKCLMSQNIGCLVKTQLKLKKQHSTLKQFFKG